MALCAEAPVIASLQRGATCAEAEKINKRKEPGMPHPHRRLKSSAGWQQIFSLAWNAVSGASEGSIALPGRTEPVALVRMERLSSADHTEPEH